MKHMIEILLWFLIFLLGTCFGSFISAIVYRLDPNKKRKFESILLQRSVCDVCKKKLNILQLVPVFSYFFLKGKCSHCKSKIRGDYVIFEVICGFVLLVLSYQIFVYEQNFLYAIIKIFVVLIFLFLAYYDYLYWEIPLRFTFLALAVFTVLQVVLFILGICSTEVLVSSLLAMLLGILGVIFLIFLSKGKGLGWGDAWVFGLVGISLGLKGLVVVFLVAICVGAISGILVSIFSNTKIKGMLIQFVPFISIGVLVYIYDVNHVIYNYIFPFLPNLY